jgi:hypothetical protein
MASSLAVIAADDGFEFGDARFDFEDAIGRCGEEVFGEVDVAVEVHEGDLGLDHPELGEVTAGLRFFRAEGGAEAVDLAQGERGGLDVELAGLGEEGGVAEVVDARRACWCLRRRRA